VAETELQASVFTGIVRWLGHRNSQ